MTPPRSRVPLSLVVPAPRRAADDGDLARGLAGGQDWAVEEAWHRFAPMVLGLTERALGSKAEAEDLTQEVFCEVFRKAATLREPDRLRAFVYSFAVRRLRSELRRRKRRRWLRFGFDDADRTADRRSADPETRELLRRFDKLLDRLRPRDRIVFVLRQMEAMTVDEIAASVGISTSTVKRSMAHACDRLSRWVQDDPALVGAVRGTEWRR